MGQEEVIKELQLASKSTEYLSESINCIDVFFANIYIEAISGFRPTSGLTGMYNLYNGIRSWFFAQKYKNIPVAEIVLIPSVINHLHQMLPVAKFLVGSGYTVLFMTNRTELARVISLQGYSVYWIHECFKYFSRGKVAVKVLDGFPPSYLLKRWHHWVTKINFYTNAYARVVHKAKPSIVLVGYDITFEGRLACRFFTGKGIPTACIQHGDMSGVLNTEHIADEFYVFGEAVQAHLQTVNRNPGTRFITTGAPYLDGILAQSGKVYIPDQLKLPHVNKYVLVAFSGPGNNTSLQHHLQLIGVIFTLAQKLEGINLVVKLHAKDRRSYYTQVPTKLGRGTTFTLVDQNTFLEQSIFDFLNKCDLIVTGGSTTALEAMIMDVPVISLDLQAEYRQVSFVKHNAVRYTETEYEFFRTVNDLLYNQEERSKTLENQRHHRAKFYRLEGSAAVRCANEIMKHLN